VNANRGILLARLFILVGLIAAWQGLTDVKWLSRVPGLYWLDKFFISQPTLVVQRIVELNAPDSRISLLKLTLSTAGSTLLGFSIGVSTGFVVGLALSRAPNLARVLDPFLVAFNSLPRIALVPLITMVFGFGLLAKLALAWSIVFFIVFYNTLQGARLTDRTYIDQARLLGATEWQVTRTVVIPSALAWTFASLTPSISFALIGVVVGELLGGESGGGLGYLITQALGSLNAADMMIALLLLGGIGTSMALVVKRLESHLLAFAGERRHAR
jgi:NitT/TauT family transport system permease protein